MPNIATPTIRMVFALDKMTPKASSYALPQKRARSQLFISDKAQ